MDRTVTGSGVRRQPFSSDAGSRFPVIPAIVCPDGSANRAALHWDWSSRGRECSDEEGNRAPDGLCRRSRSILSLAGFAVAALLRSFGSQHLLPSCLSVGEHHRDAA